MSDHRSPPRKRARIDEYGHNLPRESNPNSSSSSSGVRLPRFLLPSAYLLATERMQFSCEETNTDDEELHQLTMVASRRNSLEDENNSKEGISSPCNCTTTGTTSSIVGELNYEDVVTYVFTSARDQKWLSMEKCFRYIQKSKNKTEILQRLVHEEDDTGMTLLMICVRGDQKMLCEFLLDHGANVNQHNEKRTYALLLAAQKGHQEITKYLLDRGADEESKNMSLIPAAHFGHLDVVKLLIEYGADQNFSNKKGTTALMRAAQEGREEVVRFLLGKQALASSSNNEGMTALMLAAQRGHATIAELLLQAGSNVNKQTRQGSTALLLAAKRGHTDAVEALLTAGADIFLKDDRDKTAADTARRRGHVDLFLKISVANQLRLMRASLRRERSYDIMRLSSLYLSGRAEFAPAFKRPDMVDYCNLLDQTCRLPRPLVQNIALFLPMCPIWERQRQYLVYETPQHPNRVVQQGIRIIDEILLHASLEMRSTLHTFTSSSAFSPVPYGKLELFRDNREYEELFTKEVRLPMSQEMGQQLRMLANIQGAMAAYSKNQAIAFGGEVAQDVVSTLTTLLEWDSDRKRLEYTWTDNTNEETSVKSEETPTPSSELDIKLEPELKMEIKHE